MKNDSNNTIEQPHQAAASAPALAPTSVPVVLADSFLTLHYRLAGAHGDVINTFGALPATLSMGSGALAAALEQCLLGLAEGSHTSFNLPAGEAFGAPNPAMRQWLKRSELADLGGPDESYAVGEVVQFPTSDGLGVFAGTVLELGEQAVLFDFNHPLAGQPITFEVQVISVL